MLVHVVGALASVLVAQDPISIPADGPPLWGDAPTLVEEVRIGSLDGDPNYTFGSVSGVGVLPDGTIWVGDSQAHLIRRYDRDGAFIGVVGREGEGPGEFLYPSNMRVLTDTTVVVWDPGLIRVNLFSPDGAFLDSFVPPTHMIGGPFEELEVDSANRIYLIGIIRPEVDSNDSRELMRAIKESRGMWIRMLRDGTVVDTIMRERPDQLGSVEPITSLTAIRPLGGRITARTDAPDVHIEPDHGPPRILTRTRDRVRYARAERGEKQRLERMFHERNGHPVRDIPRDKPWFSNIFPSIDGRLWLELYAEGTRVPESEGERTSREEACSFFGADQAECDRGIREWRMPKRFEVITDEGQLLGVVDLPNRLSTIVFAHGSHVWVEEKGAYGEASVVRYRIEPGR